MLRPLDRPIPSPSELEDECIRLETKGLGSFGYVSSLMESLAAKTWRINKLKSLRNAVIPAHVYQRIEIIDGVADFIGDSFKLAHLCSQTKSEMIVFCGVRFMAETAKIMNPVKRVFLPASEAGCSLADSMTGEDVVKLKALHPGAVAVCYINTTAEVKAQCHAVVTSANAKTILKKLYDRYDKIIFVPDRLMANNLAKDLGKTIGKDMIAWEGTCIVHDQFDASWVERYRREFPGVKILAHTECTPSLVSLVDFHGGTGDMLRYVDSTSAPSYMLITECGLGDLARTRFPGKTFVPMCRLCPYMKATDLDRIESVLLDPAKAEEIILNEEVRVQAAKSLQVMFDLA
ncbi:MAG: quinolinate synthase NadA [Elusimicrobiota bacterium]